MPPTLQSLGINQLSVEDRISLVQEIWDSIAADAPSLLTEAQRSELQRRIALDDANPNDGIPWEQVKAQAIRRIHP